MTPTWKSDDSSLSLYKGDCRAALPTLEADSFTACVTDPPYHLTSGKKGGSGEASLNVNSPAGRSRVTTGFMGKAWDGGDVAMRPETWAEVLRVLKPGAHLLAFGGTRTFHRITCAIEDAGFEIRDCIMWVYGSGFPKSLDASKAMDKAAGAERQVVGRKASDRPQSYGEVAKRSLGGGNRVAALETVPATDAAKLWQGYGTALKPAWEPIIVARKPLAGTVCENCLQHGCGALNIDGCRIETGESLNGGAYSAERKPSGSEWVKHGGTIHSSTGKDYVQPLGRWPANVIHDGSDEVLECFPHTESNKPAGIKAGGKLNCYSAFAGGIPVTGFGDAGSAARFFYCAKASRSDRGEGNTHPTVKPLSLMSYLVKLVTMPGDGNRIIDPFAGSGSTLLACYNAFVPAIGIDLEANHIDISLGRVAKEQGKTPLFA